MLESEEITPPNSPRRRRITTNGMSQTLKIPHHHHPSSDDTHHPPPSLAVAASHNSKVLSSHPPLPENEMAPEEIISWQNLKDCHKILKIEKFLWDANIADEIRKTDNLLLKV